MRFELIHLYWRYKSKRYITLYNFETDLNTDKNSRKLKRDYGVSAGYDYKRHLLLCFKDTAFNALVI
jgi:hypothetical protein